MSRITIVNADITTLEVDAIVNAANDSLASGGGVCGAIHRVAGPKLAEACKQIGHCETGGAVVTPGFGLPASYVVHAVGPVWSGGSAGEEQLLESCYRRALEVAREAGNVERIAFPCISTGIFGYPKQEAAEVALRVLRGWLETGSYPREVIVCCFTEADAQIYRELMPED